MTGNYKGPLHGVPVGIKDLLFTKDVKNTMGSKVYQDFIPTMDSTVVRRLKQNGAIILGKLNTHEFVFGTTGDRSFFGPVKIRTIPHISREGQVVDQALPLPPRCVTVPWERILVDRSEYLHPAVVLLE